jgi:hypothetical protein
MVRRQYEYGSSAILLVHFVNFSNKITTTNKIYEVSGNAIPKSDSCKYLGVHLAKHLDRYLNVNFIYKKAYKTLHWVMRNLKGSRKTTKNMAYKTLAHLILEFASIVWDPHKKGQDIKLERLQRKAARHALGRHKNAESVEKMITRLG